MKATRGDLRLRKARPNDSRLIWEWANALDVRALSFSSEYIAWETHVLWYEAKINDPDCVFFIAVNSEESLIGQLRFDVDGREAVLSINLDARFRGQGYGVKMIRLGTAEIFATRDVDTIHAYVKQDNEASLRVFTKAGFALAETAQEVRGQQAYHFVLEKKAAE